ncbi:MAG: hypothetical protein KatS3mg131_0734 [Candidatus Tectimicrobiota bacterium]|nr:MAG: hypothetical protein KatS3mg131_0734 [Candidatus Tectomicrobia bacterium]
MDAMPQADVSQEQVLRAFGKRLQALRKARRLRQLDMAARGLSYKYYQRLEAGQVNPTLLTLWRVAAALQVPLRALLDDQGVPGA